MADLERGRGAEPPAEKAEAGSGLPDGSAADNGAADRGRREASAERNVRAETASQARESKERIADLLWARPKQFVERIVANRIAPYFKRFLGKFSDLDDDAMATDALKRTRDAAKTAAHDEEK